MPHISIDRGQGMAERMLTEYKSRRNSAVLMQTEAGRFVKKTFADAGAFQKELHIYSLLEGKRLPCAKVIAAENNALILSELPGQTLLECLEQQEGTGQPVWEIWEKLVAWMITFWRLTGFVMTDVNLRNFLYDEKTKTLYGLDFEACSAGSIVTAIAGVAAYIRTYKPDNTWLKQEISQYVLELAAKSCLKEVEILLQESKQQEEQILNRRKNRI